MFKMSEIVNFLREREVPVVSKADLMAAGDQRGWKDLTQAAAAATWGQAMEVPDMSVNLEN